MRIPVRFRLCICLLALCAALPASPSAAQDLLAQFEDIAFKGTSTIGTTDYEAAKAAMDRLDAVYAPPKTERQLLMQAVDALGGIEAFQAIETIRQSATTQVATPDGQQMSIATTRYADYPDRERVEQSLPMGEIVVVMNGDQVTLRTPQGTSEAPPPMREQVLSQRWRDLVYLFARADDESLAVQHVGQDEVNETPVEVLSITPAGAAEAFRLHLDADTSEPVAFSYEGQNMMTGAPVDVMEVIVELVQVGDVRLPRRLDSYQDGTKAAETVIDETELNVELEDDLFTLE